MNTIKNLCFLLLTTIALFSSCTNDKLPDDSLKHVPEDVTAVTAFNINQLMQKADYGYIQTLDFYKDGLAELKEEQPALAAILENPILSGVDLTKNAYVVMDLDKDAPEDRQFGGLVFSIKEATKFEGMLQTMSKEEAVARTNFKFIKGGDQMVAWNDDFGIIAGGHHSIDLEAYVNPYFYTDRKTSVADNKDLVKCLNQDYDMAVWMNSNSLSKNAQIEMAASFMGISKEALKGNYFHSFVNFEDGLIKGESKHYLQKELTNDLNLFFKSGVKKDLSKYIPGEGLGLVFGAALDAKGIYQVISEKTGGATTVNAGLKQFGFTGKDLANAFGGDIVVAVYDNDKNRDKPTGLMAATIGDKKLFNQFVDLGIQFEVLASAEDGMYLVKDGPKELENTYLLVTDEVFFVSNEKTILNKIKAGGYASADRIPSDLYSAISNNAFGGSANFEALKHFTADMENIPFSAASMDAGLTSSHMQVDLKEKSVNSLKSLFNFLNEMYLKDELKKEKKQERVLEQEI